MLQTAFLPPSVGRPGMVHRSLLARGRLDVAYCPLSCFRSLDRMPQRHQAVFRILYKTFFPPFRRFRLLFSTFRPWGWGLPVPQELLGPPRQQKRRRVCNLSLHRRKLNTHSHFSRLIKPSIFDKMGAAQVSCCVGGRFSCIGAWGVPALHVLPLFAFAVSCFIIADRGKLCKGFLMLLLTKWRWCGVGGWVARHG